MESSNKMDIDNNKAPFDKDLDNMLDKCVNTSEGKPVSHGITRRLLGKVSTQNPLIEIKSFKSHLFVSTLPYNTLRYYMSSNEALSIIEPTLNNKPTAIIIIDYLLAFLSSLHPAASNFVDNFLNSEGINGTSGHKSNVEIFNKWNNGNNFNANTVNIPKNFSFFLSFYVILLHHPYDTEESLIKHFNSRWKSCMQIYRTLYGSDEPIFTINTFYEKNAFKQAYDFLYTKENLNREFYNVLSLMAEASHYKKGINFLNLSYEQSAEIIKYIDACIKDAEQKHKTFDYKDYQIENDSDMLQYPHFVMARFTSPYFAYYKIVEIKLVMKLLDQVPTSINDPTIIKTYGPLIQIAQKMKKSEDYEFMISRMFFIDPDTYNYLRAKNYISKKDCNQLREALQFASRPQGGIFKMPENVGSITRIVNNILYPNNK